MNVLDDFDFYRYFANASTNVLDDFEFCRYSADASTNVLDDFVNFTDVCINFTDSDVFKTMFRIK